MSNESENMNTAFQFRLSCWLNTLSG